MTRKKTLHHATADLSTRDDGFIGFDAEALAFLRELGERQDRAWYQENKAVYEVEIRAPLIALVRDLSAELARRKIPLIGDAKKSIFRIHRDTRFSKDKSPFKAHASAALSPNGQKMTPGMLYLHIDPAGSFVASGFWHPDRDVLKKLRDRIASKPTQYHAMLKALENNGLKIEEDEEAAKRLPRGYEQVEDPVIQVALRRLNHVVYQPLNKKQIFSKSLVNTAADFAQSALPLLNYGWKTIAET